MATDQVRAFGVLLKRYREAAGLTQEALAERAGLSARAVSDLERGINRAPRSATLALLMRALELGATDRQRLEAAGRQVLAADLSNDAAQRGAQPPLVGRERELDLLDGHLAGEGPAALFLAGEPGIGKSRLLAEAVRWGVVAGWCVLHGGCTRRGGELPYAPLLQALQCHIRGQSTAQQRSALRGCAWLVRLLPELADGPIEPLPLWTLTPEHERRLLYGAVERFLANIAGPAGTLLVLDDLQWAGADALQLLTAVLAGGGERGVRVVGAYRDTEASAGEALAAALAELAQAGLAGHHRLAPLAPGAVACLLEALLPDAAGATAAAGKRELVGQRAGGVPFFVVSCALGLRTGAPDAEGAATVPWDVAQSVRQRARVLPERARLVLGVAAVAGREVTRATLVAVAGQPEEAVLEALEAACRAGLLEEQGADAYRFPHDLVREVVEADLGAARRALLHRHIAQALEQLPGRPPPALLGYHFLRAGDEERAAVHLERAGDQARAQGALADAERAYRELVGCLDGLERDEEAAAVREKLGAVHRMQCRYDDALGVLEEAANAFGATSDREGLRRVTAAIGSVHGKRNTPAEGLQRLLATLAQQDLSEPSYGLAVLLRALAYLYSLNGRYGEMLAVADQAVAMARALGDNQLLVETGGMRVSALMWCGRDEEALQLAEAFCHVAETIGAVGDLADLHRVAACLCETLGEYTKGTQHAREGLRHAEQSGDLRLVQDLQIRLGTICFLLGAWDQARASYARALAITSQAGPHQLVLLDAGRLCLAEGDWDLARSYLQQSSSISGRSKQLVVHTVAESCLAELDILKGLPGAAHARLLPLQDRAALGEPAVTTFLLSRLAWAALELGLLKEATALLARAVGRQRAHGYRSALVDTLRIQGLLHTRMGQRAPAASALDEGLSLARQMGCPYGEARLLHTYGQLHAEAGDRNLARERLEAALAIFRQLGARKDIEQTEELLTGLN